MTNLDLAKAKLVDVIGHYNMTVCNVYKFSFNEAETNLFAKMMLEFHSQMTELEKQAESKQLNMHDVSKRFYCQDDHYDKKEQCKEQCVTCFSKE